MELTFQGENYSTIVHEFPILYKSHFEEVAIDQESIPLAPDWDQYAALDRARYLFVVTARNGNGTLVGYHFAILMPGLHNCRSLMAKTDMFYLKPEYRKGLNGLNLLRTAEDILWRAGAHKIIIQTKIAHDCGALFKRMGFEPVETVYTKVRK